MPRINQITSPKGLSDAQREVYQRIATGARKGVRGPHTILLHNPELASRVETLGRYVRYDCDVPQRLRELAILAVAVRWGARYEWYAHSGIALEQGISEDVQSAIAADKDPGFENDSDRLVFLFARALVNEGRVDGSLYDKVAALLTPNGVLDLTALVGYYTLLAFVLNVFEVGPPEPANVPF